MMSDIGKIRAGSQRVYRDRIFGVRGRCIALGPEQSVDGLTRFVFHPDDIDAVQEEVAEEHYDLLLVAVTFFDIPIVR